MNILHIDSSILGAYSASRQLSAATVAQLTAGRDDLHVTYRDVAADPIPHLSGGYLAALRSAEADHTPEVQADIALGAAVLEEFLAADIVVIGAGLYNFGMPSQLKAWIDRILVAGKTFNYIDGKPVGLVPGKRILLTIARGGVYSGDSPIASFEHTETHLKTAFGFIGLTAEAIVAEGLSVGPDQRAAGMAQAEAAIAALTA
ncbi:FMN-dependent NADH-azoreductase [Sphingomonas sp. Leaf407]|uniref:FMN-dependent NADH-azoreductase n=1 Tax=unclassified Sphingomonas TaxID=196159 RepID=UPI0006F97E7E|nr:MULTISPECIES: NAD(P)H-dependent oxidoreductase [unclassified Sphingomonas]KQN39312.1 FMN-dependent NADH-azoreductase [Sphingomonas sp. Leaf42]KQT28587.1 FMN-dependent NADH-azoreductase [Sphingomonas sp. Leaf407]